MTEEDDLPERPYDRLSEEHKRQIRRFQKLLYDPEDDKRTRSLWRWGYTKFSQEAREDPEKLRATIARRYAERLKDHPPKPVDPKIRSATFE